MNKKSNLVKLGLFILALFSNGCQTLEQSNQIISHNRESFAIKDLPQGTQTATRGPSSHVCMKRIDFKAWYMSGLRQYGNVTDFSTESLIHLMDHEISTVRFFSALLLGERKEVSAIPKLEQTLSDESFPVRVAITQALLKMGNRKGIAVIEEFCAKASAEYDEGNYRNTVDLSDAARVLAEAGEVSAIPYLKKLLTWDVDDSWGVRITAIRSLRKLYAKDPSVVTDISSMLNDKHPQIRAEAAEILQSLESSQ